AASATNLTITFTTQPTPGDLTAVVTSNGLSSGAAVQVATITDAPLTPTGGFTVTATEGSDSGSQTVATFTDGNPTAPLSDFTATIDWGDGSTPDAGVITQPGGVGTKFVVMGAHTYAEESAPGTPYTITVSITDVGGPTATATSSATVA